MSSSDPGFRVALLEAEKGAAEGGIPIGACLVAKDGTILGRGHNMRIQKGSATLHGEIAALEDSGRLSAKSYEGSTMYTTLSPCDMCTGACILYKVAHVVIGENQTFLGGEAYLKQRGISVTVLDDGKCKELMQGFIEQNSNIWKEDIGEF